jgi:endonuclease/exonuclease/phosphatase family metal-dependent hydrolase
MSAVRLITLNLLNDRSRWIQRRTLIVDQLAALQPDIIALQEVTPAPDNNAHWLADQLGGYDVCYTPFSGNKRDKEGVAILSRLSIQRAEWLNLSTQSRVASLIEISSNTRPVIVATTHLHWWPGEAPERDQQVQQIIDWLTPFKTDRAIIVCGDFNGTPDTRAIRLMRDHFSSAFAVVHGHEPEYTCPTPLAVGSFKTMRDVYRAVRRKILSIAANRTAHPWRGTLDYVFVNQHVRVIDCQVVLNQPASNDAKLYPSDHFGLMAAVEIVE